jgi:hypothetical protein
MAAAGYEPKSPRWSGIVFASPLKRAPRIRRRSIGERRSTSTSEPNGGLILLDAGAFYRRVPPLRSHDIPSLRRAVDSVISRYLRRSAQSSSCGVRPPKPRRVFIAVGRVVWRAPRRHQSRRRSVHISVTVEVSSAMSTCSARPRASNQSNQPETTDHGIGEDNGVALATDSNRRGTSRNAPNDRVIRSADCLLDGLIRCPTRQASRRSDRIGRRDVHHGRSARSAQEKFSIFVPSPARQGNEIHTARRGRR